jgi:hypothetical protein
VPTLSSRSAAGSIIARSGRDLETNELRHL